MKTFSIFFTQHIFNRRTMSCLVELSTEASISSIVTEKFWVYIFWLWHNNEILLPQHIRAKDICRQMVGIVKCVGVTEWWISFYYTVTPWVIQLTAREREREHVSLVKWEINTECSDQTISRSKVFVENFRSHRVCNVCNFSRERLSSPQRFSAKALCWAFHFLKFCQWKTKRKTLVGFQTKKVFDKFFDGNLVWKVFSKKICILQMKPRYGYQVPSTMQVQVLMRKQFFYSF
jgi:hypothetical protein